MQPYDHAIHIGIIRAAVDQAYVQFAGAPQLSHEAWFHASLDRSAEHLRAAGVAASGSWAFDVEMAVLSGNRFDEELENDEDDTDQ